MAQFEDMYNEYMENYDLKNATANDKSNLTILINNYILIDIIQKKIKSLMDSDDLLAATINIKKLQDSSRDTIEHSLAIERALGIDRKSRRKENQQDVAGYLALIKSNAAEWLEKQLIYVYCPKCRVMVARILPAHEHTEFRTRFQCSQCNEYVTADRKERSVFFDIKGRKEWREKYPIEIINPIVKQEFDDDIELSNDIGDTDA